MSSTTATVEQLRAAELALEDQITEARAELVAAREAAAAAIVSAALDGKTGKQTGPTPGAIADRIAALSAAIDVVRSKRIGAIRGEWAAQAEALRTNAAALRTQSKEHAILSNDLLERLKAHEGVVFVPAASLSGMPGMTRTRGLAFQAAALDEQANTLSSRPVTVNGFLSASGRDELLAAVRAWDINAIAPALHAVAEWAGPHEDAARARLARIPAEQRDQAVWSYRLQWRNGTIVETESAVEAKMPAAPAPSFRPALVVSNGTWKPEPKPQEVRIGYGREALPPFVEPAIKIG